jgi:hypothetical protein
LVSFCSNSACWLPQALPGRPHSHQKVLDLNNLSPWGPSWSLLLRNISVWSQDPQPWSAGPSSPGRALSSLSSQGRTEELGPKRPEQHSEVQPQAFREPGLAVSPGAFCGDRGRAVWWPDPLSIPTAACRHSLFLRIQVFRSPDPPPRHTQPLEKDDQLSLACEPPPVAISFWA